MPTPARDTTATIIPTLRYRDAAAAIDWLCEAFGFERYLVVPGDEGRIDHAVAQEVLDDRSRMGLQAASEPFVPPFPAAPE